MIRAVREYYTLLGAGGVRCAVKARLAQSTELFEFFRDECKHPFWLRIPSSDMQVYKQVFIEREYDFAVASEPEVILDAGANIGMASLYFANKYPGARIFAIEPEEANFELLKRNIAPYPNIVPVQAALWHENGVINLHDAGLGEWGFMTGKGESMDGLSIESSRPVTAMTVDRIMQDHGLEKIDILKMDIEGAEKEVFSDPSSWIDKAEALIIELHERMKTGCNRSFYNGSGGFDQEWKQGENVYLSRGNYLSRSST